MSECHLSLWTETLSIGDKSNEKPPYRKIPAKTLAFWCSDFLQVLATPTVTCQGHLESLLISSHSSVVNLVWQWELALILESTMETAL